MLPNMSSGRSPLHEQGLQEGRRSNGVGIYVPFEEPKAGLTSAYTGQPIPDPGTPEAGDVWIDRSGGGVIRVIRLLGETILFERVKDGPRSTMGVEFLRKSATRKVCG